MPMAVGQSAMFCLCVILAHPIRTTTYSDHYQVGALPRRTTTKSDHYQSEHRPCWLFGIFNSNLRSGVILHTLCVAVEVAQFMANNEQC